MNGERLEALIARLRGSLWFIPTLMTIGAVLLAITTVWIDQNLSREIPQVWFLSSASAEGAREILSTIAGSVITVTGVVFSITIVALQLASSQYTPRVLRTFTDNRPTQVVLGIFIATFTYSLLVLRGVRSEVDDVSRFVPGISITIAMLFALASIGALIFFVNHIAHSIRVETVMERITTDALGRIDVLFPEHLGEEVHPAELEDEALPDDDRRPWAIQADRGGYLQHVDEDVLLHLTEKHDLILRMAVPVGSFVLEGDVLAVALTHATLQEETVHHLRATFHLGAERTLYQDLTRGTIELTDIALRALSPSLNDPTTAISCIDQITRVLHTLAGRRFPSHLRRDESGELRVIASRRTFAEIVTLPLGQLRRAGAEHPAVAERLIRSIVRIAQAAPPERIPPLLSEMEALLDAIRGQVRIEADLARLEDAAAAAIEELRARFLARRLEISAPG